MQNILVGLDMSARLVLILPKKIKIALHVISQPCMQSCSLCLAARRPHDSQGHPAQYLQGSGHADVLNVVLHLPCWLQSKQGSTMLEPVIIHGDAHYADPRNLQTYCSIQQAMHFHTLVSCCKHLRTGASPQRGMHFSLCKTAWFVMGQHQMLFPRRCMSEVTCKYGSIWIAVVHVCCACKYTTGTARLRTALLQVKTGYLIDQVLWTPTVPGHVIVAEVVRSWDLQAASASSIIAFDASSLQPVNPEQPSDAADAKIYRHQLGWCKHAHADSPAGSPPYLYAICPADWHLDDPIMEAHSTVIVVDPSSLLATPSPSAHYCCSKDWISCDGSRAVLCDASADQLAFRIFSLPALEAQAELSFPGGHPITSSPPPGGQALITWAPSGDLVAVLWDASYSPDDTAGMGPLTVHDASSGDLICSRGSWSDNADRSLYEVSCSWSPSSEKLLLVQRPRTEIPEHSGVISLCTLDGLSLSIDRIPELRLQRAAFSPCGRFMSSDYVLTVNEDQDEGQEEESEGLHCYFICAADGYSELCRYTGGDDEVIFAPNGQFAVLPIAQTVVALPEAVPICQGFAGLDAMQPVRDVFKLRHAFKVSWSPCGKILVGMIDSQDVTVKFAKELRVAYSGMEHSDIQSSLDKIWHTHVDQSTALHDEWQSCLFCPVEEACSAWLPQSISWHPCPGKYTIYAVADTEHSIFLIDAQHRACLKMWSWEALIEMSGDTPEEVHHEHDESLRLTWSPNGSQLAVAAANHLVVLTF